MLRLLLLSLMSVYLVAGASFNDQDVIKITECPVTIFGHKHTSFFVTKRAEFMSFCFFGSRFQAQRDCLDIDMTPDSPAFQVLQIAKKDHSIKTGIMNLLPELSGIADIPCALFWDVKGPKGYSNFYLLPYGDAAVLYVTNNFNADQVNFVVSGSTVVSVPSTAAGAYLVDGCKAAKSAVLIGTVYTQDNETCTKVSCGPDGNVTTTCQPGEHCINLECIRNSSCAVSGNTIIDIEGRPKSIDDFCGHKLLDNSLFSVETHYAERRLSDVPFVEKVLIKVPSLDWELTLAQGGKIFNKTGFLFTATENGTAIEGAQAQAFKVPGGVLTSVLIQDTIVDVFFDGTTVHIHYEGPGLDMKNEMGICFNASNINPADGNPAGCGTVVSDPRGDGIDCDEMKQRCDMLKKEPFASCSVDAEPYITACSNLLCNYTDTDGLLCHLLDAYARACQLKDWMDTVGCSISGCHEHECVDKNEFCGLSIGGYPRCFCRSSYSAPFRTTGKLGKDTVCASKSASISLVGCLLEEKGINISSLHLNNPSCTGVHDPKTNQITFSFNDANNCAANVSMNGTKIIYSNTIKTSENTDTISREDQVSLKFSCAYIQPQVQTMSLKILDSSVVKVIDAGEWTYVFNMTAYTDPALTSAVANGDELKLDQPLWVQAKASEVDEQLLALVIEKCWATMNNDPNATQKYYLIKNGCSNEETVSVVSNGEKLGSVFSFRVFQFIGSDSDVFLHCETKLCLKSDGCTKVCGGL